MELERNILRAMAKSLASKYSTYLVNAASLVLLSRIFGPETFGLVAASMIFFTLAQLLGEAGLTPIIINLSSLPTRDRDGLFTLSLLIGCGFGIVMLLLAQPLAAFFRDGRVTVPIRMMAVALPWLAGSSIPTAFILRDQKFHLLAIAGIAAEVGSVMACLTLRPVLGDVGALSAKMPVSSAIAFLILHRFAGRTQFGRPWPGVKLWAIGALWRQSTFQFLFNLMNFLSRNADNVLVGRFFGLLLLAYYDKAYQLMRYPLLLLSFAIVPAIQPAIRHIRDDPMRAARVNTYFAVRLAAVGWIGAVLLWFTAEPIVSLLLGANWAISGNILSILAASIPAQVVAATSGAFYQAFDRNGTLLLTGALTAAINLVGMLVGIQIGTLAALATCLVVAFAVSFMVNYIILYRLVFRHSPLRFFGLVGPLVYSPLLLLLMR